MASTVVLDAGSPFVIGDRRQSNGTINLATYATGGIAVTPAQFGFSELLDLDVEEAGGLDYRFNKSTVKVMAYMGGEGDFTPAGTIASTLTKHADSAGTPAGTNAVTAVAGSSHVHGMTTATTDAELTHTHAVALDTGASAAGSAHQHAQTGVTNAASVVNPEFVGDLAASTKPVITLTHNADPQTNLNAEPLFITEAYGSAIKNVGILQSTTDSNADVLGETADGIGGAVTASCRFFVKDNNSPTGVQIYVNEGATDQLEFVSPTTTDAYIVMPYEVVASGIAGYGCVVKVTHNASADSGKALFFDDNGAADAQLVFVDAGAAGGVVPAADITVVGPFLGDASAGSVGTALAQVISGSSDAESAHTHASGTLGDAASGVGSSHTHGMTGSSVDAEAAHTHANTVAFTGSAMGTHSHESTVASAFTGTAVTTGGVAVEVGAISLAAAGYTARFEAIGR